MNSITEVTEAVAEKIAKNFDCPVYFDDPVDSGETPCFQIRQNAFKIENHLNDVYYNVHIDISIYYIADESVRDVNALLDKTAFILSQCVDYIEVGGHKIRGLDMEAGKSDDMLNFSISYDFIVKKDEAESDAKMLKLIQNISLKK